MILCFADCVESPLSDRKLVSGGGDVTSRLRDIWRQARELKSETQLLRQAHIEHVTVTKQLLQATFVKMKVDIFALSKCMSVPICLLLESSLLSLQHFINSLPNYVAQTPTIFEALYCYYLRRRRRR